MKKIGELLKEKLEQTGTLVIGEYEIKESIGGGQQSNVFKFSYYGCDKDFVIKILNEEEKPRVDREIEKMRGIRHSNLISILKWGRIIYDSQKDEFKMLPYNDQRGDIYVIEEFVEGYTEIKDLFAYVEEKEKYFWKLVDDIMEVLNFLNTQKLVHLDVHEGNIIYSEKWDRFMLIDYGFIHGKNEKVSGQIARDKNQGGTIITGETDWKKFYSEVLIKVYTKYIKDKENIKEFLDTMGEIIKWEDEKEKNEKYIISVYGYWKLYKENILNLSGNGYIITSEKWGEYNGYIKIPVSGGIPTYKELRQVIDTESFQRLRYIKQLGVTHLVYPGATHTRFEHSIGVYYMMLKYLEKLLHVNKFKKYLSVLFDGDIEKGIRTLLFAALLHDIGHYPFSHWIEEMQLKNINRHENNVDEILNNDGRLREILEKFTDIAKLKQLIKNDKEMFPLTSLFESIMDVDKIDYVIRDSFHCGVPYGNAIDIERLINSLWFNEKGLLITEKGISSLIGLFIGRIIMYRDVYWHKTVRCATSMMKRAFYYWYKNNQNNLNLLKKEDRLFYSELSKDTDASPMWNLLEKRDLYKTLFSFSNDDILPKSAEDIRYPDYVEIMDMEDKVKGILGIKKEDGLLIEFVPRGKFLQEYNNWGEKNAYYFNRKNREEKKLLNAVRTNILYVLDAPLVYVYIHPDLYGNIQQFKNKKEEVRKVIKDEYDKPLKQI